MTLSELLRERAERFGKKTCVVFEGRNISYGELDRKVDSCASGLIVEGLMMSDRAVILMDNCPEYIVAYFAVIRAGGVAVPVNTFLNAGEISYIIRDSGAKILIYSDSFSACIGELKKTVPGLQARLFQDIQGSTVQMDRAVSDGETAVLLYTSGTTGFPKGVMLSHANLISNASACQSVMQVSGSDRILLFLPLFHAFSFTVCVILPFYAGAVVILLRSVKPFSRVMSSIFRHRITFFVAVPTVYNILARKQLPWYFSLILRLLLNIRACVSGAAALPESTLREFEGRYKVPLLEGYGLTEAGPVVAVNPLKGKRKPGSVGLPLPGVDVRIMGDDGGRLSAGSAGELLVKGPGIMKGYFNNPQASLEVLKDGWLYTGDIATIDTEGYISIVDRKKDILIIDGMNIYPREVEDAAMLKPAVEECAMVGIPDGRGSEVSVLFVKTREGMEVSDTEIHDYLKGRVARFKVPRRIIYIDEFPKTATGKIKKSELRKWRL